VGDVSIVDSQGADCMTQRIVIHLDDRQFIAYCSLLTMALPGLDAKTLVTYYHRL
jgi:hypothetical protein